MATPYLGEIKLVAFNFAPKGWALCNGQTLPINQNQALFAILGTTFGGNGQTTFALPNLQGRVPVHRSGALILGEQGGAQTVTLATSQIGHTHVVKASATATTNTAAGNYPATSANNVYGSGIDTPMLAGIVGNAGAGQPHDNMQPYLVLTYVIALSGIFPSRN